MNSASLAPLENGIVGVLLNYALPALSSENQSLSNKDNVPLSDLLSKNLPVLDKLEKLKSCQTQLILEKAWTIEYFVKLTEALNISSEIIQENWNELPISVQEQLKKRLNIFRFEKNISKIIFSLIRSWPFALVRVVRHGWRGFSNRTENRQLVDNYIEAISNIRALESQIRKYGHPLKTKNSENFFESDLVPFVLDENTIYLSPNSAEGKALERLKDIDDPEKWFTAVDYNEEIDLEDLDKKIRESGYLV
jgi:hypothetical protein